MYVENKSLNTMYVGGRAILPGEGRDIAEADLPPEMRQAEAPVEDAAAPSIDELLSAELKQSVAALVLLLPSYKLEALDRMAEIEGAGEKPRKSLLAAIDAERLKRASATLDSEDPAGGSEEGQATGKGPDQVAAAGADPVDQNPTGSEA